MEEERNEQGVQDFVNQVYENAVTLMFEQNKNIIETKNILIEQGLKSEDADIVIKNLQRQFKEEKNKIANNNMLYGALWCSGGLLITFLTYTSASKGGGSYVITWGAIIWGILQFVKGLYQKISS